MEEAREEELQTRDSCTVPLLPEVADNPATKFPHLQCSELPLHLPSPFQASQAPPVLPGPEVLEVLEELGHWDPVVAACSLRP